MRKQPWTDGAEDAEGSYPYCPLQRRNGEDPWRGHFLVACRIQPAKNLGHRLGRILPQASRLSAGAHDVVHISVFGTHAVGPWHIRWDGAVILGVSMIHSQIVPHFMAEDTYCNRNALAGEYRIPGDGGDQGQVGVL